MKMNFTQAKKEKEMMLQSSTTNRHQDKEEENFFKGEDDVSYLTKRLAKVLTKTQDMFEYS